MGTPEKAVKERQADRSVPPLRRPIGDHARGDPEVLSSLWSSMTMDAPFRTNPPLQLPASSPDGAAATGQAKTPLSR